MNGNSSAPIVQEQPMFLKYITNPVNFSY